MRRQALTSDRAEAIALAGLSMLAGDPERIARFFALSGLDPADIRQLAMSATFQCAVLAHIRGDETLLLAFAANQDIDPLAIGEAERILSGEPGRA